MIDKLKININDNGNILLSIEDSIVELNSKQTLALIDILNCAINDGKDLVELFKKKNNILKNYNSIGRTIKTENEK